MTTLRVRLVGPLKDRIATVQQRLGVKREEAARRIAQTDHDGTDFQRNALVQGLAKDLGIALLFLPSSSPNLNRIERLWRFMKRQAAYGRYHPTFADFRAAIEDVLGGISTTHADKLATLMTLNFQEFDDVSLLAA